MALTLRLDESENRLLEVIKKKHNDKYEYNSTMQINTNSGIIKYIIKNFLILKEDLEKSQESEQEALERFRTLEREIAYKFELEKEIEKRDKIIKSYLKE